MPGVMFQVSIHLCGDVSRKHMPVVMFQVSIRQF